MREYEIDGEQFSTLEELLPLLDAILTDSLVCPEGFRVGSIDGLDEALGGWFNEQGTEEDYWPEGKPDSFILRWKNSSLSRERLGHPAESLAEKKRQLARFYWAREWVTFPFRKQSMAALREEIDQMKQGVKVGPTMFELIEEIFRDHAPAGPTNEGGGVILVLE